MAHALFISPVSKLPVIVNEQSSEYANLLFMGYTIEETGTKKQLERIEEQIMIDFCAELELNQDN